MRLETIRQHLNHRFPMQLGTANLPPLPIIHETAAHTPPAEWDADPDAPPIDESCRSTATCENCGTEHEIHGNHHGQLPLYCTHCGLFGNGEQMHTLAFRYRLPPTHREPSESVSLDSSLQH